MKPAMLCLLLLPACSDLTTEYGYRAYRLTWVCQSSEACERAEQVALHDRVEIGKGSDVIEFRSTRDEYYYEFAQMVSSDELPAECSLVYGLTLFAHELEPSRLCRNAGGFELELSIPNRDPMTRSTWLIEGLEVDP
jgi:hypothetical protein